MGADILIYLRTGRSTASSFLSLRNAIITKNNRDFENALKKYDFRLVLIECGFLCVYPDCAKTFLNLLRYENLSFALIRPYLLANRRGTSTDLNVSQLRQPSLDASQRKLLDSLNINEHSICTSAIYQPYLSSIHKIMKIQKMIIDNPAEKRGNSFLAKQINMSSSWLSRNFKDISGVSICCFRRRIKCCCALWQLLSTQNSIKAIALGLGYKPISLTRNLFFQFKVTPSMVRANIDNI